MVSGSGNAQGSTWPMYVVTILACVTQLALTGLTTYMTLEASLEFYIFTLAITAAILGVAELGLVAGAFGLFYFRPSTFWVQLFRLIGLVIWFSSSVLSLVAFALILATSEPAYWVKSIDRELAVTGLVVGAFGLVPQAAFIVIMWPRIEQATLPQADDAEPRLKAEEAPRATAPVSPVPLGQLAAAADRPEPKPGLRSALKSPGSPSRSILKSSPKQVIRPVTSRTRLIQARSPTPRESTSLQLDRSMSMDPARHDGFESWDTSAVEESFGFSTCPKVQARPQPLLETIPGSRPESLVGRLEKPPRVLADDDTPLPDSPTYPAVTPSPVRSSSNLVVSRSASPISPNVARKLSTSASDNNINKSYYNNNRSTAASGSNVAANHKSNYGPDSDRQGDELRIHPLFRTESPGPRPAATPGTTIVASPHAGKVISREQQAQCPRRLGATSANNSSTSLLQPISPSASTRVGQRDWPQLRTVGSQLSITFTPTSS